MGVRDRQRHVVCAASDFPSGTQRSVRVGSRAVAIFNVDGRFYALRDVCPHQGAALSAGAVVSEVDADLPGDYRFDSSHKCVKCPWHGWEYDLKTGHSYYDPAHDRVRAFSVAIESAGPEACAARPPTETDDAGGRVRGPYQAETVEVRTEAAYVVLYL
jgi:nitrite reductase/ring-hydroxylating ferredoxin subunit